MTFIPFVFINNLKKTLRSSTSSISANTRLAYHTCKHIRQLTLIEVVQVLGLKKREPKSRKFSLAFLYWKQVQNCGNHGVDCATFACDTLQSTRNQPNAKVNNNNNYVPFMHNGSMASLTHLSNPPGIVSTTAKLPALSSLAPLGLVHAVCCRSKFCLGVCW